jgi:osmotically-inducible protein OsmY
MVHLGRVFSVVVVTFGLILSGACSQGEPKKSSGADFLKKSEEEASRFAEKKKKEHQEAAERQARLQQESRQRQKEQMEAFNRSYEQRGQTGPDARSAGSSTPGSGAQVVLSDQDLTTAVLIKLRMLMPKSTVSISCHDGIVELFGTVPTAELRKKIISELGRLPGVKKIDHKMLVVEGTQ